MNPSDLLRLLLLAAIWGGSFLFMRIAAPEFGPFPLIFLRVAGGALVLLPWLLAPAHREPLRRHWRGIALVGLMSAALPWVLFAYAALGLEAGLNSVINATTPIWTAAAGAIWFRTPLHRNQAAGLLLGLAGVAVLAGDRLSFHPGGTGLAVLAALGATMCYALVANFTKARLADVPGSAGAAGFLFAGGLMLAPAGILAWPAIPPSPKAWACAAALAVVCSGFAFLLFFDLVKRVSAVAATSVTYLIPVFGVLWGALFLQERLEPRAWLGATVILAGTVLTARKPAPPPSP